MNLMRTLAMHEARKLHADGAVDIISLNEEMAAVARKENPSIQAYTHFLNEEPPAESDHPLASFYGAIKANIAVCGGPLHCGSRMLRHYRSPFDSTVVTRLRSAGCRFMGVSAMDEFGMGSTCEYTHFGQVVNPWDNACTAGGSSGGSAAAVAAGHAWFALGSDTGGSVRLPAHFCGVVGLKPTWGRISRHGLVAFASSLDTIGILGRDLQDVHQVFQTLAGGDPLDGTSLLQSVDGGPFNQLENLRGLKLGVPEEIKDMDLDDDVRQRYKEDIQRLVSLGAEIVPLELGSILDAVSIYTVLSCAEAASNLHRYDGSLFGSRVSENSYGETLAATRSEGFGSEVKRRLLLGAHVLSSGFHEQYYLRAGRARQEIVSKFRTVFSRVDLVAMPTAPGSAFALGSFQDDPAAMHLMDILTVPASLAGIPALTFPTGLDRRRLPLSLQLIGPSCSEKSLMQWARVLEKDLDFRSSKEAPWQRLA